MKQKQKFKLMAQYGDGYLWIRETVMAYTLDEAISILKEKFSPTHLIDVRPYDDTLFTLYTAVHMQQRKLCKNRHKADRPDGHQTPHQAPQSILLFHMDGNPTNRLA